MEICSYKNKQWDSFFCSVFFEEKKKKIPFLDFCLIQLLKVRICY